MRLLFVHDGPLFIDDNGLYYEFSYHNLFERYSYIADSISFLMRVEKVNPNTKYDLVPKQIRVVEVPEFKRPLLYFRTIRKVKSIIRKAVQDSDVLILRLSSCASIAMKYAKKYNKPYIFENVGCSWDSLWNYSLLGKIMAPFAFFQERRDTRNSMFVYYVTNSFLQKRYPCKHFSVNCSNVVLDDRNLTLDNIRFTELSKDKRVIFGTAAAIDVKYKGQQYFIKAIKKLVLAGYDVEYRLAGGNKTNSKYLENLVHKLKLDDRVVFLGSLDKKQMSSFYEDIDIYIHPSLQEGLPRSIIEAMSHGRLCLGARTGGIPELIGNEWCFKRKSKKGIISKINELFAADTVKIQRDNFAKSSEYTFDVLKKRTEEFYDLFMQYISSKSND